MIATYAPGASKTISLDDVLDETMLLCKVRSQQIMVVERNQLSPQDPNASITIDHLATVARLNYLNSVANQIQSVSPLGDISSALRALFASYEIKVADTALAQTQLSNIRSVTENRCEYDLKDFDRAYGNVSSLPLCARTRGRSTSILPVKTDLAGGAAPAITAPGGRAEVTRSAGFFGILLHHGAQCLDTGRQAKALETRRDFLECLTHSIN